MIILGIDPGLATLGYGVIESLPGDKNRLIQYGTLNTKAGEPMPQRLRAIWRGMNQLMDMYQPDDVAFEELFFSKNITTGMNVSMARGVAMLAVAERTENLYEYTPMQIKQAVTGYGGADKHQVQMMVKMMLNMKEIAKPDDAADAVAVALTHANSANIKKCLRSNSDVYLLYSRRACRCMRISRASFVKKLRIPSCWTPAESDIF